MSPDPRGPLERAPIRIGEVWENPITRERVTIVELLHQNPEGRAVAEVMARVGARVAGEHRHPKMVERFTVLDGELTVKRGGNTSILRQGETATIEPGRMARLVECGRARRSRARGSDARRALHQYDRDLFWPRARLARRCGRYGESFAAGPVGPSSAT
jgi:mannose-6-phosphate isomerase-like protein (cupin superfamily)